jgi:hypothetical protein
MTAKLDWRGLYWLHIGALNIPLVEHAGEEWVLLHEFQKDMGVGGKRFVGSVLNANNIHRGLRPVTLLLTPNCRRLAVARVSLMHLAQRIQPGTNNKLLIFVNQAMDIALGEPADLIVRRAAYAKKQAQEREMGLIKKGQERERLARVKVEVIQAFDRARVSDGPRDLMNDIESLWREKTGLGPSSLHKTLRGTATDKSSLVAYETLGYSADTKRSVKITTQAARAGVGGRKAKLTAHSILEIRRRAQSGVSRQQLAKDFATIEPIIKKILNGTYSSNAMREAMATEST